MRDGIAQAEATGLRAPTFLLVPLLETYIGNGRNKDAGRLLEDTLAMVHQTGHRLQEAELYRLKGQLLLQASCDQAGAEACYRRAIEVAQRQSAKWWQLRASVSLARLLRNTNRRDEARTKLTEIYNWFTEGFENPDLKEAKALLDELD
jgi:hypothetical protein